jgi:hypothetical protein
MNVFLMYPDADFDATQPLPAHHKDLVQDLELATLLEAMASRDPFLFETCGNVLVQSMTDPKTIRYRQDALRDAVARPNAVRALYDIAVEAIATEKKTYWGFALKHPSAILHVASGLLRGFLPLLRQLRAVADDRGSTFQSHAFHSLRATLQAELSDEYLVSIERYIAALSLENGLALTARLGDQFTGAAYVLNPPEGRKKRWYERIFESEDPSGRTFRIDPRDESGASALADLSDRGIGIAANALAQATDHILKFFIALRSESAFYVGCLNLHAKLLARGIPVCFPSPIEPAERERSCSGLYDVCLALQMGGPVTPNDLALAGQSMTMITGANKGGKSTFLRSVGVAQLMMQCGMFVAAQSMRANLNTSIFTHYKREEDASMESGKLDEELARMSEIVDRLSANVLLLLNESFACTDEREGSEIARQVTDALIDEAVEIFYVTHLYDFSEEVAASQSGRVAFLRAEREADGARSFKIVPAPALQTSFGDDIYNEVFGRDAGGGSSNAANG